MPKLTRTQREDNEDRAERAAQIIEHYRSAHDHGEPDEAVLGDLLADLMHYAHLNKVPFDATYATAQVNFQAEKNGEG